MKPYWQSTDGLLTVYHGDMRDLCKDLRADAVITDAPFGIGDRALDGTRKGGKRSGKASTASAEYHAASEWDRDVDPEWCRAASAAAPVVAWFGSWRKRSDIESASHPIRCEIVWAKDCHVGPPCPAAMRDERIWIFSRDAFVGQHFETTVWDEPIIPTWEHRYHKNQKPERLMGRLVRWVAPPAWTIGDPFMGSGTTLVACQRLGRNAWGIDSDRGHCDTAIARLGAVTAERAAEACGPLFAR